MSYIKRRDSKNRILNTGESQDADGRYSFRYTDSMGRRRTIYSWKLTKADVTPAGKRDDIPLRDKEKQIQAEMLRGVYSDDITVCELVDKYLLTKTGVKHNTEANYNFVRNILKKELFGQKKINKIKVSDAKVFLIKLQDDGRGYSTIHSIRGVLRPAFQMAVEDEMLVRNPFEFQLATVVVNDSVTRQAISRDDERKFLEFIRNDKHYCQYYEAMLILFKTGLRISEFCGLTVRDIDLKHGTLNVDHQLQRTRKMEYLIVSTKTSSGTRRIPITEEVKEAFSKIINNRPKYIKEPIIDGYTGFLFLDKNGRPLVSQHWEKYFQRSVEKHNKIFKVQLPIITPHVCRHTYCSNMAKAGTNPKTLQYLMGHSDIGVTLNTYTHIGENDARDELERLDMIKDSGMEYSFKKVAY